VGYEVVAWIGAVLVLVAYWDVTSHGTSMHYHVMNLGGAIGLLANALHHRALPSSAVNVVWAFIALWGMRRTPSRERPAAG
jgi:hypothetical protein